MPPARQTPAALSRRLARIRDAMLAEQRRHALLLASLPPPRRPSAANLLHYLALRRHDLRTLHKPLAALGLSSLGRAEIHALDNVLRVLDHLPRRAGPSPAAITIDQGERRLADSARRLLGHSPRGRPVRIMVTMPSHAADQPALIRELLAAGMDVMRINCAHDGPEAWSRMIEHLRSAQGEVPRPCRVMMDIAGPKIRTGALAPGPRVVRWRVPRDPLGNRLGPALLWLTPADRPAPAPSLPPTAGIARHPPVAAPAAVLPIPPEVFPRLRPGDRLSFRDARGRRVRLHLHPPDSPAHGGLWATAARTAYLTSRDRLTHHPASASIDLAPPERHAPLRFTLEALPAVEQPITLRTGDRLRLTADQSPGVPARLDPTGRVLAPASIPFTLPAAFAFVRPGHEVWLDDGKIGAVVTRADRDALDLIITHARPGGTKLRADKGINLPHTPLDLPALTPKDLADLPFIARHADLVGYSFVSTPEHVRDLRDRLAALRRPDLGIVLKVETRRAFERLPELLLAVLPAPTAGVMIARGDLAVELGWERLAEVQEEILWLCEAAHLPVIWATQVLERLAKKGQPSRAEITDAAMSTRAECVMLNKGPYITKAVAALDDILRRMQHHLRKKTPQLRPLTLAKPFPTARPRPRPR
jgi:pyruvate kinase